MFTDFTPAQKAVHYPSDRRLYLGLRKIVWYVLGALILLTVGMAWLYYLIWGLPQDPSATLQINPEASSGFPGWVILCHWVNFFFLVILIRSGLSVLADHPRLYWNNSCKPGTEWVRFTPIVIPPGKLWTAKEDARYLSPVIGLPGYKHTVGIARHWHFLSVPFYLLNGAVFIVLLFITDHWQRLIPASWDIIPNAWHVFIYYATFHLPVEPNGFYNYNALQQLSYFAIVFLFAPLAMVSGMAMSPAVENRYHWIPKLFINRQGARSVHFMVMLGYLAFTLIHVSMVAATGLQRNMNHIIHGTDDPNDPSGIYIGIAIVLFVIAFCFFAHWVSWKKPRYLQRLQAFLNGNFWFHSINRLQPKNYFEKKDITPYFWPNGKLPESADWRDLAAGGFKDYKLKVGGMVAHPMEFSLEELAAIAKEQNITMHHCIQGWSGIAEWGGIPISKIVDLVKPHPSAQTVVFYSFGDGLYGGTYYDTHTLENCLKAASILAWEMNYEPLPEQHGAPLRLRIENQLGYKMVKWIDRIEFVESYTTVGKGFGGKNEDDEYFDLLANT